MLITIQVLHSSRQLTLIQNVHKQRGERKKQCRMNISTLNKLAHWKRKKKKKRDVKPESPQPDRHGTWKTHNPDLAKALKNGRACAPVALPADDVPCDVHLRVHEAALLQRPCLHVIVSLDFGSLDGQTLGFDGCNLLQRHNFHHGGGPEKKSLPVFKLDQGVGEWGLTSVQLKEPLSHLRHNTVPTKLPADVTYYVLKVKAGVYFVRTGDERSTTLNRWKYELFYIILPKICRSN